MTNHLSKYGVLNPVRNLLRELESTGPQKISSREPNIIHRNAQRCIEDLSPISDVSSRSGKFWRYQTQFLSVTGKMKARILQRGTH